MNDYMEVQHGSEGLKRALRDHGKRFSQSVEPLGEGFAQSVLQVLDEAQYNAHFHTYLLSFSEHLANDAVGRLSMWRAYGGPVAGVALVLNPIFLEFDSTDLAVWSSPVLYGDEERFSAEFLRIIEKLEVHRDLIMRAGKDVVRGKLINPDYAWGCA